MKIVVNDLKSTSRACRWLLGARTSKTQLNTVQKWEKRSTWPPVARANEKGVGRSRSPKIKYRKGSSGLPLQGTAAGKRAEEALRLLDTRTECNTHTQVKSSIYDFHSLLWLLSITNSLAFYLKISESDVEKMMEYGLTNNNSNRQINVNPAEYWFRAI